MISAREFRDRWTANGDQLLPVHAANLAWLALPADDLAFLVEAGLPVAAAPYLSFAVPTDLPFPNVAEEWDLNKESFARLARIGINGSGDPIAIEPSGRIVCLNHDDNFALALVNSSPRQFAASLLGYRELIQQALAENGPDAFLDGLIPDSARNQFISLIQSVDPSASVPGTFWADEIASLVA